MHSVIRVRPGVQTARRAWAVVACLACSAAAASAADAPKTPAEVVGAAAKAQAEMKPYTDVIANGDVTFDMVPIPGGKFPMGSPGSEAGRGDDEGPQHEVEIEPFWMGKCEVTWNEYEVWMFNLDIQRARSRRLHRPRPKSRPTPSPGPPSPTPT